MSGWVGGWRVVKEGLGRWTSWLTTVTSGANALRAEYGGWDYSDTGQVACTRVGCRVTGLVYSSKSDVMDVP